MAPKKILHAPSIDRRRFLALGGTAVAATGALTMPGAVAHAQGVEHPGRRYFPHGDRFDRLAVLDGSALSTAEGVLAGTLQGLVARGPSQHPVVPREAPHIYLTTAELSPTSMWLDDLHDNYGIGLQAVDSVWELLRHYQHRGVDGYVLYDDDPSTSVATTLAGLTGSVAIHTSLSKQAEAVGLHRVADVTGKDDAWLTRHFGHRIRRDFAVEQKPSFGYQLRDLATLAGAQLFYDGNSGYRNELVHRLRADAPVIGWGDASEGEDGFVSMSSKAGTFMLAADWAVNLSTLSGAPRRTLRQRGRAKTPPESGVHYVTFVVTDGDNLQWLLTGLPDDAKWWASPDRGRFPVGWGIAPTLNELAPTAMHWYYDDASTSDEFVVGPSGSGYFYPSQYPPSRLRTETRNLAFSMGRSDLGVVQILDFDALQRTDVWDQYTRHDAIDGLIYLEYSRYDAGNGKIVWSHDKPVISARHMLWDGIDGADEASVTDAINAAPRNLHDPDSYTVVTVHAWSKTMSSIRTVVDNLDPQIRVVSPGALTDLVRSNVRH